MSARKVFQIIGLQRSGNHAMMDWIGSLFGSQAIHNNNFHSLFADPDNLGRLLHSHRADCTIFSFEDSGVKGDSSLLLLDSVAAFPSNLRSEYDFHRLLVLRDPYNTWASRLRALYNRAGSNKVQIPELAWQRFRANWLSIAEVHHSAPRDVLLFNKWVHDENYRRSVCSELGGTYSEKTLEAVRRNGGGSSFDGLPRPNYFELAKRWREYLSPSWRRKVFQRPFFYVGRLLSPRATGKRLKVTERWRSLENDRNAVQLLKDREIFQQCRRVFPDVIDTLGDIMGTKAPAND